MITLGLSSFSLYLEEDKEKKSEFLQIQFPILLISKYIYKGRGCTACKQETKSIRSFSETRIGDFISSSFLPI